jgi:myo-inositol-1(or 4)-monophosphatase
VSADAQAVLALDWLRLCRRCGARARDVLAHHPDPAALAGPSAGGDTALAIDRAVEDGCFEELGALGVGLQVISEERGEVALGAGGDVHVVIDPIDGSRNASRGMPAFALSIAVASGPTMGDVELGFVLDLGHGEEWRARRGGGSFLDGARLPPRARDGRMEVLGIESAHPRLVARHAAALEATGAARLRGLGSVALSLCHVAAGRFDAAATLAPTRSVDCAAAQLIVREAGGAVAFPEAGGDPAATPLSLDMRSRVLAAVAPDDLTLLAAVGA